MGAEVIGRRELLAGTLASAVTLSSARSLADVPVPPTLPTTERLIVSSTRTTDMTVWQPLDVAGIRGVALLSTGHGSWPERYSVLADLLESLGYVTLAPMHVDSVRHPDRAKFTMQASFGERIADMTAASAWSGKAFPGSPVIAVGHSFGTLTSLCRAGALAHLGDFRDPLIKAVLGFSTPGRIPGLIPPHAYASVTVPLMIVTGTADLVPGFVADPADHLLPVNTARGPAYGVVMNNAGHELIAHRPSLWLYRTLFDAFVAGHSLGDAGARARLSQSKPVAGDRFIIKNVA